MNKRFDVMTPRKGKDDKTHWHRVGTAFDGDKGITVYLDSSPYPDSDGRVVMKLFEPREGQRSHSASGYPGYGAQQSRQADAEDESIPF